MLAATNECAGSWFFSAYLESSLRKHCLALSWRPTVIGILFQKTLNRLVLLSAFGTLFICSVDFHFML